MGTAEASSACDAELQALLADAASRIVDFQHRMNCQRQQLELETVLAPQRAQHEEEVALLRSRVEAAEATAAAARAEADGLAAMLVGAQSERDVMAQRAQVAEAMTAADAERWAAKEAGLRVELAAAQARGLQLDADLQVLLERSAADSAAAQQALDTAVAAVELARRQHAEASVAWAAQRADLEARQVAVQQQWEGQLMAVRAALKEQQEAAAAQALCAATAEAAAEQVALEAAQLAAHLADAAQQRLALAEQLRATESALTAAGGQLAGCQRAGEAAQEHGEQLAAQLEELRSELQSAQSTAAAAAGAHDAEAQQLRADLARGLARQDELQESLEGCTQRLVVAESKLQATCAEAAALRKELGTIQTLYSEQQVAMVALREENVACATEASASHAAATAELDDLRSRLAAAQAAAVEAREEAVAAAVCADARIKAAEAVQQQQAAEAAAAALEQLTAMETQSRAALVQAGARAEAALQEREAAHAAVLSAVTADWEVRYGTTTGRMRRLAEHLASDPHLQLPALDAMMMLLAESDGCVGCSDSSGPDTGPSAGGTPAVGKPTAEDALRTLCSAVLALWSSRASALERAATLQGLADSLHDQLGQEHTAAETRLSSELKAAEMAWNMRCDDAVAAKSAEWRAKHSALEDKLAGQVAEAGAALQAALARAAEAEQQAVTLAAELAATQRQHAVALNAAGVEAAARLSEVREAAARERAAAAADREAAEVAVRKASAAERLALQERHHAELAAAEACQAAAAEEARAAAHLAEQRHDAELQGQEEEWQLRLVMERDKVAATHAAELAEAAATATAAADDAARRHECEVARLREAIVRVERGERQALKLRAKAEARADELHAELRQFERRLALIHGEAEEWEAEAARRVAAAVQAAQGEAGRRLAELAAERDAAVARAVAEEARACSEPRPADAARIAQLEQEIASLRATLAAAEQKHARLRQEVLLREETYNKTFAAGGAGLKVLDVARAQRADADAVGWMLRASPGRSSGGSAAAGSPAPLLAAAAASCHIPSRGRSAELARLPRLPS